MKDCAVGSQTSCKSQIFMIISWIMTWKLQKFVTAKVQTIKNYSLIILRRAIQYKKIDHDFNLFLKRKI